MAVLYVMIGVDVWGVANILSNVKILFILFIDLKINITSNFIIMITITIYCILLLSMFYSDACCSNFHNGIDKCTASAQQ